MNCAFNNGSGTWDNNGGANWNFNVTANSTPQAPPTPLGFNVTAGSASQINVSWMASPNATGYIVSRDGLAVATNTATSYADSNVSSNFTYCYQVVATNSIGNSASTAAQCVTLQAPIAPAGLLATAVSTNQINVTWPASAGAGGYVVDRDSSPLAATAGTNFVDTGLAADSQHCYTVTATNNVGGSPATAADSQVGRSGRTLNNRPDPSSQLPRARQGAASPARSLAPGAGGQGQVEPGAAVCHPSGGSGASRVADRSHGR